MGEDPVCHADTGDITAAKGTGITQSAVLEVLIHGTGKTGAEFVVAVSYQIRFERKLEPTTRGARAPTAALGQKRLA